MIIAAAGGAAHLPGMLAAKTLVPVLGVPVPATSMQGLDALLSIVQMPKGVQTSALSPSDARGLPTPRCWPQKFSPTMTLRCASA